MMMIDPHSRARKGGKEKVKVEYRKIWVEEGNAADQGGMVQTS